MRSQDILTSELPLVQQWRGSYVESRHEVSACVAAAEGDVLFALGDIEWTYPIRSLAKPFLATEFIRSGAADAFGVSEMELALAAGSHDGEQRHVAAVRAFLARLELNEESLLCGPAMEGKIVVGPPVANNCSGKHTAALGICRHKSFNSEKYTEPDHPVQRMLIPPLLEAFGRTADDAPLAIDGCGMPIFGASLRQIATAYARFGVSNDASAVRVRDAMTAEPGYAGGWFENLDTRIMTWSNGAIVAKIGAEGLHADSIVSRNIGIAVKVHDGNSRAIPPLLVRLFTEFIDNVPIARQHLAELAAPVIRNAAGRYVGSLNFVGDRLICHA